MHAHLEAGYPHEACGILIGEVVSDGSRPIVKVVKSVVTVPNVWEVESEREGLHNRYLISPEDVARAIASVQDLNQLLPNITTTISESMVCAMLKTLKRCESICVSLGPNEALYAKAA